MVKCFICLGIIINCSGVSKHYTLTLTLSTLASSLSCSTVRLMLLRFEFDVMFSQKEKYKVQCLWWSQDVSCVDELQSELLEGSVGVAVWAGLCGRLHSGRVHIHGLCLFVQHVLSVCFFTFVFFSPHYLT